jgi:hypothetical protein
MFEWYKRIDDHLKNKLSGVNLFKLYPNYFISKVPFQIAAALILILSFGVWAGSGFNLAYVNISCPTTNPTPCLNPVYVCPYTDMLNSSYINGYFWHNDVRCNTVPSWVCEQVPCDKPYLMQGESYGAKSNPYKLALTFDFLFIFLAFAFNHLLYMRTKLKCQDRQN